jgi:hypothetical protein
VEIQAVKMDETGDNRESGETVQGSLQNPIARFSPPISASVSSVISCSI